MLFRSVSLKLAQDRVPADDIAAATLNDLLGHYQRWYGPANAVLSLTVIRMAPVALAMVGQRFRPDIELFGYRFEPQ